MNQKNRLLYRTLTVLQNPRIMLALSGTDYDEAYELRYAIKKNLGLLG